MGFKYRSLTHAMGLLVCVVGAMFVAVSEVEGAFIAGESFVYTDGANLEGQGSATGGWTSGWTGDTDHKIRTPGLTYTDGLGNTLNVAGNAVRGGTNDAKHTDRDFTTSSSNTWWMSVLITAGTGNNLTSVSLEDKFYMGQGRDSTDGSVWSMSDANGFVYPTTGGTPASGTAFLVAQLNFDGSGDETAWLWLNPNLNAEPAKSAAAGLLSPVGGTTISSFDFPEEARIHIGSNNDGIVDELRIGTTYADVSPFTAVPEPSAFLFLGLVGLACGLTSTVRRRRQPARA